MTHQWEILKNNPERLEKFREWKRKDYAKKKHNQEWLDRNRETRRRNEQKRKEKDTQGFKKKAIEKTNRYYKKHKFKILAYSTNKKFNNKNQVTPWDLWKLAKRQKLICALTGEKLTPDTISLDHIIPKSKGGKNVIENLRFIREDVNYAKRTMSDEELLAMCKSIVNHLNFL